MTDQLSGKQWEHQWLHDVLGDQAGSAEAREAALAHVADVCRGRVKFFKAKKGWGAIESSSTPTDVWVHFSAIEAAGYRILTPGEPVEFRWEPAMQDSFRCRATWVRQIRAAP